ncbi:hypothetical protein [Streptomyces sp. NRRL S-340]|uniref:hypothetical protein n=1 Tax=Streptomyces sp. NRRL S-340 TaxID=1463901 RepID=UPI000565BFBB|nr:hypothetical protein [Streptomyces sp. NRRL S-340]
MKRENGRGGTGHGAEAALDDLYTVPPAGFVARREELAGAARADGRAEDARRIHAARRPTLAAWAANLLLRSRPAESEQFLQLGRALREAYRTLDADGLRELSARRQRVVAALSGQAAQLARDAGHPLSGAVRQELESTLRAVLSDPDAAGLWAAGRLHSALTPPSAFPGGTGPEAGAAPAARRPAAAGAPARSRTKDELDERRRKRRTRLAAAGKAAEEAAERLRALREEHAEADARARRAGDRCDQAGERVSAAEEEVRRAGEELRRAREGLRRAEREREEAEGRLRTAADALTGAEREARRAEREADRAGREADRPASGRR